MIKGKEILITGGTGTLGRKLTKKLLSNPRQRPKGIRIYSRDEFKQWQFKNELEQQGLCNNVAFLIGDIRDKGRLSRAMNGVDIVINTAAMKQVPACEYNPLESVKTNIDGTANVINCSIDNGVDILMHISTDKAVYPINLYGACKAVAEKMVIHGNVYGKTKMSVCRYGNVLNSRGSVIPLFQKQYMENDKHVTLTHPDMTRFFITIEKVVQFIYDRIKDTIGAEIFVPPMKSLNMSELIEFMFPDAVIDVVGIRQGEKLHECLISYEESLRAYSNGEYHTIPSAIEKFLPDIPGALYSNTNPNWWSKDEFMEVYNEYH